MVKKQKKLSKRDDLILDLICKLIIKVKKLEDDSKNLKKRVNDLEWENNEL